MNVSKEIKNSLIELNNMPDLQGDSLANKVINFAKNLFLESVHNDNLIDSNNVDTIQRDNPNKVTTAFAMQINNGKHTLIINPSALNSDYAGFKAGPSYSPTLAKRNSKYREIIETLFHEKRHIVQQNLASGPKIVNLSENSIIYCKEILLTEYATDWYLDNHDKFYIEQEAMFYGSKDMGEFVNTCMPNSSFAENCNKNALAGTKACQTRMDNYFKPNNLTGEVFCDQVNERIDSLMLTRTSIYKFFEQYPILNFLYKRNGKKRNIEEILQYKEETKFNNQGRLNEEIEIDGKTITVDKHIDNVINSIIIHDKDLRNQYETLISKDSE